MISLFNLLVDSNRKLINLLKINYIYKTNTIINNFTTRIIKLTDISDIDNLDNINIKKGLEIEQENYDEDYEMSRINDKINNLKIKELVILINNFYDYEIGNNDNDIEGHALTLKNKYLKRIYLSNVYLLFDFCNLTFITLELCKIIHCDNIIEFLNLLSLKTPNLIKLELIELHFNNSFDEDRVDGYEDEFFLNDVSESEDYIRKTEAYNNINLKKLKYLEIKETNTPYLNVSKLTSLVKLRLISSNICRIDGLLNLINLKILLVSRPNISFDVPDLNYLNSLCDLSKLNLTKFSTKFSKNLTKLNSIHNKIKDNLNDLVNLLNLVNLVELSLTDGNIDNLKINNLINLTKLEILNNNIKSIELSNLVNIKSLDLSRNTLSNIDLSELINITWLNLSRNKLSEIDLSNLKNLKQINLSNNKLNKINLKNLKNLIELNLSRNELTKIDLTSLTNLKKLEIQDNFIEKASLTHLKKLEYCNIRQNSISHIDISGLSLFSKSTFYYDKPDDAIWD